MDDPFANKEFGMPSSVMYDRFADMIELSDIPSNAERILRRCPFAGQAVNLPDDEAPPTPGAAPVASAGIAVATLPETAQDAGKDRNSEEVFRTPPEQQSLSSTSRFRPCVMHKGVQTDDETQGFVDSNKCTEAAEIVDLTDDSELGFPEVKLKQTIDRKLGDAEAAEIVDLADDSELGFPLVKSRQRVDRKLLVECSRGKDGARVSEIPSCEIDKFRLSKRELSSKDSLGESPHKKMKNSQQKPGFESPQVEPHKIGEDLENCQHKMMPNCKSPRNFEADPQPQQNVQSAKNMRLGVGDKENACGGNPAEKNLGSYKYLGSDVTRSEIARRARKSNLGDTEECVETKESREGICEAKKLPRTGEGDGKTVNGVAKTSERQKGGDKQQEAKGKEEKEKGNSFVFDVLKALVKENSEGDTNENVSWLQLVKDRGFPITRPFWWKDEDNGQK